MVKTNLLSRLFINSRHWCLSFIIVFLLSSFIISNAQVHIKEKVVIGPNEMQTTLNGSIDSLFAAHLLNLKMMDFGVDFLVMPDSGRVRVGYVGVTNFPNDVPPNATLEIKFYKGDSVSTDLILSHSYINSGINGPQTRYDDCNEQWVTGYFYWYNNWGGGPILSSPTLLYMTLEW